MEPNKSSHLTNDIVTLAGEYCAGQKWHHPISYYINPSNGDAVKVLVAAKNFSNYKDDDKYTKVSSLKESTPCRGNSKGI